MGHFKPLGLDATVRTGHPGPAGRPVVEQRPEANVETNTERYTPTEPAGRAVEDEELRSAWENGEGEQAAPVRHEGSTHKGSPDLAETAKTGALALLLDEEQPEDDQAVGVGQTLPQVAASVADHLKGLSVETVQSAASSYEVRKLIPPSDRVALEQSGNKIRLGRTIGNALKRIISGDPVQQFNKELQKINAAEKMAKTLQTPADFAAKTAEFKQRYQNGESLEEMRVEAYAVAREAAWKTLKMRPYDCQVMGALAMDDGFIAEMRTGEGKTLTAVLPLYLNSLAGKGSYLVTVNDTLAARDAESMKPAFEMLDVSVGTVLADMTPDQRRAGYAADVTYLTDQTLGFDYLRDRTARSPEDRVQREFFYATIDEIDEVLIDEARTPLIISQKGQPAAQEYETFTSIVESLVPGQDYYVDSKRGQAWLTETGMDAVENELSLQQAQQTYEQAVEDHGEESREAREAKTWSNRAARFREKIRAEGEAFQAWQQMLEKKPSFWSRLDFWRKPKDEFETVKRTVTVANVNQLKASWVKGPNGKLRRVFEHDDSVKTMEIEERVPVEKYSRKREKELKKAYEEAKEIKEQWKGDFPSYELWSEDNMERVHYLDACLKARALFKRGEDYIVTGVDDSENRENGEVHIVDENKGRTSEGRRFNDGLHQALEAKERVPIKPEQRAVASITYPNLFKKFHRLSGMSGTAKTSEGEFVKRYDLSVVQVPTNLQFQLNPEEPWAARPHNRIDEVDDISATLDGKLEKVVDEALEAFEEGIPVLAGTLSVKVNKFLAWRLHQKGVPEGALQVLNADSVRDKSQPDDVAIGEAGTITKTDPRELRESERVAWMKLLSRGINPDHYGLNGISLGSDEKAKRMAEIVVDLANRRATPVVLNVPDREHAERLQKFLKGRVYNSIGENSQQVPQRVKAHDERSGKDYILGQVLINYGQQKPPEGKGYFCLDIAREPLSGKALENYIIGNAGVSGMVTVATNMAGRGADIKPDLVNFKKLSMVAADAANKEGKPVVIQTKDANEARRIGEWLHGNAHYGVYQEPSSDLPGVVEAEDEQGQVHRLGQVMVRAGFEGPVPDGGVLLKTEDFPTGGLYVIGTERASSRRIDDQLIGRSARQGAPGRSKFFLSLQDELMRLFGAEKYVGVLGLLGDTGQGVQSELLEKAVAQAQGKVEEMHFETRDNTTKYDEVLNQQRDVFWDLRDFILDLPDENYGGEDTPVANLLTDYAVDVVTSAVQSQLPSKRRYSLDELEQATAKVEEDLKIPLTFEYESETVSAQELPDVIASNVRALSEEATQALKGLPANKLREAVLSMYDLAWCDHLDAMEQLKQGIGFVGMIGEKPEDAYKRRGFDVFAQTLNHVKEQATRRVFKDLIDTGHKFSTGEFTMPGLGRKVPGVPSLTDVRVGTAGTLANTNGSLEGVEVRYRMDPPWKPSQVAVDFGELNL